MISEAITYPFTEEEFNAANAEWGCNCGPSALAFALQVGLDTVRPAIPDFDRKRYTSPQMMIAALAALDRGFVPQPVSKEGMFLPYLSLVRVQWTGPWTKPGSNPRWAYGHTHWVTTWKEPALPPMLFDCNGGVRTFESWAEEIVPTLTAMAPRRDGGWHPTHVWQLERR